MMSLYETPRGDFAPAPSLTVEEALALRDHLTLDDLTLLRAEALDAVLAAGESGFATAVVSTRRGPGLVGVRGPAFNARKVA